MFRGLFDSHRIRIVSARRSSHAIQFMENHVLPRFMLAFEFIRVFMRLRLHIFSVCFPFQLATFCSSGQKIFCSPEFLRQQSFWLKQNRMPFGKVSISTICVNDTFGSILKWLIYCQRTLRSTHHRLIEHTTAHICLGAAGFAQIISDYSVIFTTSKCNNLFITSR